MKDKMRIRGFSANPPKDSINLGFVHYYDGMEGGVERATNYMEVLKDDGYIIIATDDKSETV
jgi:hypothetical protein